MRLDQVTSGSSAQTRQEATFKVVPGIADSGCVSFSLGDGRYLRHYDFRLRADRHNGSELFKQDATFCPRPSSVSDAVMLESVQLPRAATCATATSSSAWSRSTAATFFRADAAFRLVKGLG